MKVWLVKSCEEYGDSYPLKVFVSKDKALKFVEACIKEDENEEYPYTYYCSEIEADLDE